MNPLLDTGVIGAKIQYLSAIDTDTDTLTSIG